MASASGFSFTLNGKDYGDSSHNLWVRKLRYPRMPEVRLNQAALAQADGVVTQGQTLGPRFFALDCIVVGSNLSNMEILIAQIVTDWESAHIAGATTFSIDGFSDSFSARPIGSFDSELALISELFTLELIAPNPNAL